MVWERSDSIALAALVITTSFALLNYLYARRRTQSQPRIYISKVKLENPYIIRENMAPCCRIMILFRNSGDISTVLDLNIGIQVRPVFKDKIKNLKAETFTSLTEYEFSLDSGQNHLKAFTLDLEERVKDWEEGYIFVNGTYLGYKDKERNISLIFSGKSSEIKWKTASYIIEEDTFLGVIRRIIWTIQYWYQNVRFSLLIRKSR